MVEARIEQWPACVRRYLMTLRITLPFVTGVGGPNRSSPIGGRAPKYVSTSTESPLLSAMLWRNSQGIPALVATREFVLLFQAFGNVVRYGTRH